MSEIIDFNLTNSAIAELKEKFCNVSAQGADGYKAVTSAISEVKNIRVGVEKYRKEKNREILKASTLLNDEAKRITTLLREIEDPLVSMKKDADAEKERVKEEKRLVEVKRIEAIKEKITETLHANPLGVNDSSVEYLKVQYSLINSEVIDKETYAEYVGDAEKEKSQSLEYITKAIEQKEAYAKQQEVLKQEQEAAEVQRIENERVTKENAEKQAAIDEKNAETQRTLDQQLAEVEADKQKLADEEAARAEVERVKASEIQAAADAEAKVKRDQEEKEQRKAAEKLAEEEAEKTRIENLDDSEFLMEYHARLTELGRPEIRDVDIDTQIKTVYDSLLTLVHDTAVSFKNTEVIGLVE